MMMNETKTYCFRLIYLDLTQRSFKPLSLYFCKEKENLQKCNFPKSQHHFASGIASLHALNLRGAGRIFPRQTQGLFFLHSNLKGKTFQIVYNVLSNNGIPRACQAFLFRCPVSNYYQSWYFRICCFKILLEESWFKLIKFSFSEKATKIWSYLPLVLTFT